jgi:tRNA dimethylallyltransferase
MARHILIVGPTASGKSERALREAERRGGEVASLDAFQVYRGLNIGTGKLPETQRCGIPHHLIDCVDALENFSVADYLGRASDLARKTEGRPLVWAGGTGLYAQVLTGGLCQAPDVPLEELKLFESLSLEELQKRSRDADPAWWQVANISERSNPRRLARVAGVFKVSGVPLSAWQEQTGPALLDEVEWIVLDPDRGELEKKIRGRVAAMLESGWVEEVKGLLPREGWERSQSASAIGYREIIRLVRGETTRAECEEAVCIQTRQYAKRQRTWFARWKAATST